MTEPTLHRATIRCNTTEGHALFDVLRQHAAASTDQAASLTWAARDVILELVTDDRGLVESLVQQVAPDAQLQWTPVT